jgi:hypothetical protein
MFVAMTAFAFNADVGPNAGPVANFPPMDDPWDMVFYFDAGTTADDTQLLGVAFAVDQFFITGANSGSDPNNVYVFEADGSLAFQFTQPATSTGWGWRDLAYDGTYLYGSVTNQVEAFDLAGNLVPAMNINGPITPCRALAYDPNTDSFWTQSFGGPLYNFDRSGAVLWTGTSGVTAAYGAGWHDGTDMLWIFSQDGSPQLTFYEFDPVAHALTGVSQAASEPPGWSGGIAGGASYTTEYDPGLPAGAFVFVSQGSPTDYCAVLEAPETSTPVELSAFNANVVEDGVMLTWSTASELNCYEWTVQRNGVDVATLPGNGTTVEPQNYSYLDEVGAGDYTYRLKETDLGGAVTYSDEITVTVGAVFVTEYSLSGNYPNPFNPTTNIAFALPEAGMVNLSVYSVNGSQVATLVDGNRDAGAYEVTFDATSLTSGIYFYKLTVGDYSSMHKMVLMK